MPSTMMNMTVPSNTNNTPTGLTGFVWPKANTTSNVTVAAKFALESTNTTSPLKGFDWPQVTPACNLTGNFTGNFPGNPTGNLTGNFTRNLTLSVLSISLPELRSPEEQQELDRNLLLATVIPGGVIVLAVLVLLFIAYKRNWNLRRSKPDDVEAQMAIELETRARPLNAPPRRPFNLGV